MVDPFCSLWGLMLLWCTQAWPPPPSHHAHKRKKDSDRSLQRPADFLLVHILKCDSSFFRCRSSWLSMIWILASQNGEFERLGFSPVKNTQRSIPDNNEAENTTISKNTEKMQNYVRILELRWQTARIVDQSGRVWSWSMIAGEEQQVCGVCKEFRRLTGGWWGGRFIIAISICQYVNTISIYPLSIWMDNTLNMH